MEDGGNYTFKKGKGIVWVSISLFIVRKLVRVIPLDLRHLLLTRMTHTFMCKDLLRVSSPYDLRR